MPIEPNENTFVFDTSDESKPQHKSQYRQAVAAQIIMKKRYNPDGSLSSIDQTVI
jgi:hypothetical protein